MTQPFQKAVFTLYEQQRLRNWFYTLAFAIFVPTGCRFAILAWEYGDWFDKPLSLFAGALIGITAVVTLLRVWAVPPSPTVTAAIEEPGDQAEAHATASEICDAAKHHAAHSREIAKGAAALGSTHHWPFDR